MGLLTDMDDSYNTSYRNVGSVFFTQKTGMEFLSIPESVPQKIRVVFF